MFLLQLRTEILGERCSMKFINIFTLDIRRNVTSVTKQNMKRYHDSLLAAYLLAAFWAIAIVSVEYKLHDVILSIWHDSALAVPASKVIPVAMCVAMVFSNIRMVLRPDGKGDESAKSSARFTVFVLLLNLIVLIGGNYYIVFQRELPDLAVLVLGAVALLCAILFLIELIEYVVYHFYDKIF